jgi:hypothetical protein
LLRDTRHPIKGSTLRKAIFDQRQDLKVQCRPSVREVSTTLSVRPPLYIFKTLTLALLRFEIPTSLILLSSCKGRQAANDSWC